jgi:hypothetical protein
VLEHKGSYPVGFQAEAGSSLLAAIKNQYSLIQALVRRRLDKSYSVVVKE